jgi:hypothetical protein
MVNQWPRDLWPYLTFSNRATLRGESEAER